MQSLIILGRQPKIGLAELESLYGADKLTPISDQAVLVDVDPCLLAFGRLGGAVKFCKVLTTLDTISWKEIEKYLLKVSPEHSKQMPEGKMTLGFSLYGFNESIKQIEATGLSLKKIIRKTGRPVRLVPNKEPALSSAQILHNKLTGSNGWDLVFIKTGSKTVLAQGVKVQNIESYAARDQTRPKRDSKVGMLPPKLAQIIVNLAVGLLPDESRQSVCEIPPEAPIPAAHLRKTILDPFCGSGVILQEALLMGYGTCGTDIDNRMVEYSKANMDWLAQNFNVSIERFRVEAADATEHRWRQQFDALASEVYLGRPFSAAPRPDDLKEAIQNSNLITKKFLKNLAGQIKPGFRTCLAVPVWKTNTNFTRLPLLDSLEELGYNRVSFERASDEDLIYHREGQIVGRELLVLIRK